VELSSNLFNTLLRIFLRGSADDIVIKQVSVKPPSCVVTVTVVVPIDLPYTRPEELTIATD